MILAQLDATLWRYEDDLRAANFLDCLKTVTIKAVVHPAEEGGFWAEVPALPGCFTQGESLEEVRENLKEAIAGWLEAGEPTGEVAEEDQILELAV